MPGRVADQPVKKYEQTRDDKEHEQEGEQRATSEQRSDLAEHEIARNFTEHDTGDHQDDTGGEDRDDAALYDADGCLMLWHSLAQFQIAVGEEDRIVDRCAELYGADDQVGDVMQRR